MGDVIGVHGLEEVDARHEVDLVVAERLEDRLTNGLQRGSKLGFGLQGLERLRDVPSTLQSE
jgi:hypothetical protein